ncbi:MAG: molybdopterin molybdenumtransferase MoeA [Alphaproteobacteria bacterium]|nr:molybdopterin molybdenumtransferase MoeA [Alphaproteobacteria bacterium]
MRLLQVDTVKEARGKMKEHFEGTSWRSLEIPLHKSVGRYLAQDIVSRENLPGFSRSVVDGYAVHARETVGVGETSPLFLQVAGEVEMGTPWTRPLEESTAVYVPTGGMVPPGADGVVMVEHTEMLDEKTLAVHRPVAVNQGIMGASEDLEEGALVFAKGHRFRSVDVGVLAALGLMMVPVFDQPVVSVISTGDEIISIIEKPTVGKVRDVNSFALSALVQETGCMVGGVYLIGDNQEKLEETLKEALSRSDVVLISGGSSQGTKDYTAQVVDSLGKPGVITHGLALKPGKPTILGVVEDAQCACCNRKTLVAGLPGHPVAAMGVYHLVIEPFLQETYFQNQEQPLRIKGILGENLAAGEGRETVVTVELEDTPEGTRVIPVHGKSGMVSQLLQGVGYLVIPESREGLKQGTKVEVTLFK